MRPMDQERFKITHMAFREALVAGSDDGREFPKRVFLGAVVQTLVNRFCLSDVRSSCEVVVGIWAIEDVYSGAHGLIPVEEVG